ncbi:hypothetical protein CSW60_18525 [Caulobacter sp. X]|nr:hypothetical protein CSW60_18525 [Caulobacter sp. X]
MGRPKLPIKSTQVQLGAGQAERIDALVGQKRRSKFIRDAIDEKLAREAPDAGNGDSSSGS